MINLLRYAVKYIAPIFIVTSPVTSYADQVRAMHKQRSSAGFSLEIPLIMLIASITKIFYFYGERYDIWLFVQACIMVLVQFVTLQVALRNRPLGEITRDTHTPFAPARRTGKRPFEFWQWRDVRPYWLVIAYFTGAMAVITFFFRDSSVYFVLIGYVALSVEAFLPIPQILSNHRNRSCKGFRLSVLANWLLGDVMKMTFFFLSENPIPWAFKWCGLFQWACDIFLGIQYWQFGEGHGK